MIFFYGEKQSKTVESDVKDQEGIDYGKKRKEGIKTILIWESAVVIGCRLFLRWVQAENSSDKSIK